MQSRQTPPRFRNRLLSALPSGELDRLASALERVTLARNDILEHANTPIAFVYFPETAVGSVLAVDGSRRRIEAGPFGREGASGLALVHGVERSPHETSIQVSGEAYRISAGDFRELLQACPVLRELMLRFAFSFTIQTAYTVLAMAYGVLEVRLARWLLMIHDRVDGDELWLTHDFLATLLAVRRPGVTVTLHELEGRGLIRSKRGYLLVRDRQGLEKLCGTLYGASEAAYKEIVRA